MTSLTNNNEDLGAITLPLPPPELKVGNGSVNLDGKNEATTKRDDLSTEIVRKVGTRVPVEISSRLIYEDDLPAGGQGKLRDISEQDTREQPGVGA